MKVSPHVAFKGESVPIHVPIHLHGPMVYTHSKQVDKKILYFYMNKIFTIVPYDIPPCCQIFYHSWLNFKKEIPEYAEKMNRLSKNAGIIYCPDCIAKKLEA